SLPGFGVLLEVRFGMAVEDDGCDGAPDGRGAGPARGAERQSRIRRFIGAQTDCPCFVRRAQFQRAIIALVKQDAERLSPLETKRGGIDLGRFGAWKGQSDAEQVSGGILTSDKRKRKDGQMVRQCRSGSQSGGTLSVPAE